MSYFKKSIKWRKKCEHVGVRKFTNKMVDERVLRVSQLDVLELDEELLNTLDNRIAGILQGLPASFAVILRFKPELIALIRVLLWRWSIYRNGVTFGQEMMGLTYLQTGRCNSRTNSNTDPAAGHLIPSIKYSLLGFIIFWWIRERFEDLVTLLSPLTRSTASTEHMTNCINAGLQLANCINFCSFLLYGVYPSLKERILHLKMTSVVRQTLRQPSYKYMNREIIWYGFSEFLFFVLPQINFFAVRNWCKKAFAKIGLKDSTSLLVPTGLLVRCVHCNDRPILPQVSAECGHVFCYYCIAANLKADKDYPCDACGKKVTTFDHACHINR